MQDMCSGGPGSGDVLGDVAALVAERNRIEAALARRVRAAELSQAPERDGLKSTASWLRGHCRLSAAAASRLVTAGRVLEHLPALAEAHDTGLVSAEQGGQVIGGERIQGRQQLVHDTSHVFDHASCISA